MRSHAFAAARFALYALVLAALTAYLLGGGDEDGSTRFAGTTSQGTDAAVSFDGDHVRWIGLTWKARCTRGWVLGPYWSRYFPSDLEQHGGRFSSSKPDPTLLAQGPVRMELVGVVRPGRSAQGTFSAITRGRMRDGTSVRCRTGMIRWSASRPY